MDIAAERSSLLRSMLFVPGDSDRKLAKCSTAGADALILDLEDSVAAAHKTQARGRVAAFLEAPRAARASVWVRINGLGTTECDADLHAVVPARPDGIVLPKAGSPDDAFALDRKLTALERSHGLPLGATRILPIATETPAAVLALGGYRAAPGRLAGLTWGAEDLSAAVGATATMANGEWLPLYAWVRALCLLAAAAAGVVAIDTICTDLRDEANLRRQTAAARRDGFAGKLAIHPAQVPIINEGFEPSPAEIAYAEQVVAAFGASEGTGVVAIDGKMLDRPHLLRARRTLLLAGAAPARQAPEGI